MVSMAQCPDGEQWQVLHPDLESPRDVDQLECVQRKAAKMIPEMKHLSYKDRLRAVTVQPGKEQTPGTPDSSFSVSKGRL